jgi:probable HAF family extracellular repeat protein
MQSRAVAINNRGQVAGSSCHHAFVWQNGTMRSLGTLGHPRSDPLAINERGQIVGSCGDADPRRPFIWEEGRLRDFGTPPNSDFSEAVAINDRGQVIGESGIYTDTPFATIAYAVLWQHGEVRYLDPRGGQEPVAINNRGQALYTRTRDGHAFLWQTGKRIDLGSLAVGSSGASAINGRGQIIGSSYTSRSEKHAFVWQDGKMTDLGTLGGTESKALAINERGQIIGLAETRNGRQPAVLWTPQSGA